MPLFDKNRIDDDEYLRTYVVACDPAADPPTDDELPDIRAVLKLEWELPPSSPAEAILMSQYARIQWMVRTMPSKPCEECHGLGWVRNDVNADAAERCSKCHGRGKVPA